jgi:hypothetical protein
MTTVKNILKDYLSERVPRKVTNVLWEMFNGFEAAYELIEYRLNVSKRERNIITAQNLSSLRSHAASNGFEPTLMIPASGLLQVEVNPKLFKRAGYPLYITPYSTFTDKISKRKYYYSSDKTLSLSSGSMLIPVIEGEVKTVTFDSTADHVNRFYLLDHNISNGSVTLEVNGTRYLEVKSFPDNNGVNSNKQFMIKFGNDISRPIVIYATGIDYKQKVNISYRVCNGELGNITGQHEFETQDIIDNLGSMVEAGDDELTIVNVNGFDLGSNGTDENMLRASIGFNHGVSLLFDNLSYTAFIGKYSTLVLQGISNPDDNKQINNIRVFKKQSINTSSTNPIDFINQYKDIISNNRYVLSSVDKVNLSNTISKNEYTLTSHNLVDPVTCKFAFQLLMPDEATMEKHSLAVMKLLYAGFSTFLHKRDHVVNIDSLMSTYMQDNDVKFEYTVFNSIDESRKLDGKVDVVTSYIVSHDSYLPVIKGDFNICDAGFNAYKLFFDVNAVVK